MIEYPEGVSRLVTFLVHYWSVRRCRRVGHTIHPVLLSPAFYWPRPVTCEHCGQILTKKSEVGP